MLKIDLFHSGLKLKSPVIAASSGITETVDQMLRAEEAGAGAVVMKSYFENSNYRIDPTPHFKILRRKLGAYRSDTLYSFEQASEFNAYEYAEEIARTKRRLNIPVIANIDFVTEKGCLQAADLFAEAGADALEVKACPHGELMASGKNFTEQIKPIIKKIKSEHKIPVIIKLVPQLTDPVKTGILVEKMGADSLVMFNRFLGLEIDIEKEAPILHGGYAGHGGLWSIHYALKWLSSLYPETAIPLIGSGGAVSGQDIIKYILSGAFAVEVCTAIILKGYEIITEMNREIKEWMKGKGYKQIKEFRGKATQKIQSLPEIQRGQKVVASINRELCAGCGRCARS
ncbi:MAG: dihydroorotate dehydrogenase, partial [Halanaerobiales bacterium]